MKWFISLLVTFNVYAGDTLICQPWTSDNTFELYAELDESGATYLDAYVDLKVIENGKIVFEQKQIDSTGFYSLATINRRQVYLAELRPIQAGSYSFLSIAANHPIPSGNSYLIYNGKQYLAECKN